MEFEAKQPWDREMERLREKLKPLTDKFNFLNRIGLKNRDFTIISDNCWGGSVYQHFAMQYRTPFVGLFLFPPCYVKLLQDFQKHMTSELRFKDPLLSRYREKSEETGSPGSPLGVLGDDIEIHFLHYRSEDEARQKWDKRKRRINYDNILFKFCDRLEPSPGLIRQFDQLPFSNKLCFTIRPYPYGSVMALADLKIKKYLNCMVM